MPELFPVVDKIKKSLFNDKINNLCKNNPVLLAMRDNVDNSLTHISFKNRVFCPYESTIRAIYAVSYTHLDVYKRQHEKSSKDLHQ